MPDENENNLIKPGRKKGNPRQLNGRAGRAPVQVARDREEIIRLRGEHKTDEEIAEILNARPDVNYTLSRRTVTKDRNSLMQEFNERSSEMVEFYITEEAERLDRVEAVAWEDYFASREETVSKEVRELTRTGSDQAKENFVESETRTVTSPASPSYQHLQVILRCIDQRARLRGLYKAQLDVNIRKTEEHHIKLYRVVSPTDWDEEPVEGDYE